MINNIVKILFLGILLNSCNSSESIEPSQDTISMENKEIVSVTESQFKNSNMQLGKLSKELFSQKIKTTGMLDVPPENRSTVSAYFAGYVKNISLLEGQKITKGQVLFTLENPDYIQIQQDFLEAKSQLNYLKSDYERQLELSKDNTTSQKVFSKAESDYKVTNTRFESLKKKLNLMNINPSEINENNLKSTITILSPISGYITTVNVTQGMFLNPSDVAITITNTDHIHVELSVFEKDLMRVHENQNVEFQLNNSNHKYQANVYLINKIINKENRTINIHCHIDDRSLSQSFTPGMYVEAEIMTTSDTSFALPIEAVINQEGRYYVLELLTTDDSSQFKFKKVEVEVGDQNTYFVEILNAEIFNKTSEFLVKGGFNLISE